MKITEASRKVMGYRLIQNLAEQAACDLFRSKKYASTQKLIDGIFCIAHTVSSVKCRKNHPTWTERLDAAIRAKRKGK